MARGKPIFEAWVFDKDATYLSKSGELVKGRKIYRSFSNFSEAKSWRRDAGRAVEHGQLKAAPRITLREVSEDWLVKAEAGEILTRSEGVYKPSTLRGYRKTLEVYVYPDLGGRRLGELRPEQLEALIGRLRARGLSRSRIKNVLIPLQAIYRHHRRQVPVNPTVGLKGFPEAGKVRDRVASPEEAVRIVDALPEDDRALWATAMYAGLRRGEMMALRDDDVDLKANLLRVRDDGNWDDREGRIAPKSKKGVRLVPIIPLLRGYLLEHRAKTGRRGTDLFFGRTAEEPFTPSHIGRRAQAAWAATAVGAFLQERSAEIEPIGLHECRHTFVSLMHAAGVPLERIGDYVGHSSTYMTDRYRHLIEGQREEDAAALDVYLSKVDA
jgi:integrase